MSLTISEAIATALLLFTTTGLDNLYMQRHIKELSKVQVCFPLQFCMHLQANVDSLNELQLPYYNDDWRPLTAPCYLDVRKITDERNQLAYHLAWQGSFCYASILLDPTVSIENVLEFDCSSLDGEAIICSCTA